MTGTNNALHVARRWANDQADRSSVLRGLRHTIVHRELYLSRLPSERDERPIALVYGNCQAEALRRILVAHHELRERYHLLRVPAVHEVTATETALIRELLPRVGLFVTQEVRDGYRGMPLGTDELIPRLPPNAVVCRWPVAYFTALFPFHVYVHRGSEPVATPAPISDYHDLRILHAAGRGWSVQETVDRLAAFEIDPAWVRRHADRSLRELVRREAGLHVRLGGLLRDPERRVTSFHTMNHPTNDVVTEMARQALDHLGFDDADRVLGARQTYLDHLAAPREAWLLRALDADPALATDHWRTSQGPVPVADVVAAHLELYAADPDLLRDGLDRHRDALDELGELWRT